LSFQLRNRVLQQINLLNLNPHDIQFLKSEAVWGDDARAGHRNDPAEEYIVFHEVAEEFVKSFSSLKR